MRKIASKTQDVYRRQAARFDRERSKSLFERAWLERFAAFLPHRASILDVGCGSGEPIAQYFIGKGYQLTGIDYAASMIDLVKQRFPEQTWLEADMRQLDLGATYDGIIGWHSFFHLTQDEQRTTLPLLAGHLNPSGVLMLTVGSTAGEVIGHVGGEKVYHSSLAPEEYRQILQRSDLEIIDFVFEDPSCDFATVLLARRS